MVIRPFSWRDILLIRRLENAGLPLHPQYEQKGRRPLHTALSSPLPLSRAHAYVLDGQGLEPGGAGFVILAAEPQRREGELLYLAPSLEAHQEAARLWLRLLSYACAELAGRGCVRFYASLPRPNGEAPEVFRQAGFVAYSRDEIYRRPVARSERERPPGHRLRRQRRRDAALLLDLFARVAPRVVQQAETLVWPQAGERLPYPLRDGHLVEADARQLAHIRLAVVGEALVARVLADLERAEEARAVLRLLVRRAARRRKAELEVHLPEYVAGLRPSLLEDGFEPAGSWLRLVKQTTLPVREAAPRLAGRMERVNPTPTRFEELSLTDHAARNR